jgi:hypothetical protein
MRAGAGGVAEPCSLGVTMPASRVTRIVAICVLLAAAGLGVVLFARYFRTRVAAATEVKKVHMRAYLMAHELKRYVGRTGHFPSSLDAACSEGELERHYVLAPQGCMLLYSQPLSNAPSSTEVFVVSNAVSRASVTKDFHIQYQP